MNNKKNYILLLKTILATLAIVYYCEIQTNIVFSIIICFLVYVFFKESNYKKNIYTTILSIISNFLLLLGKYIVYLSDNLSIRSIILRYVICGIGGFILFKAVYNYIFEFLDKKKIISETNKIKSKYIFIGSFIIILISWIVILIAEYPGPIMQDTLNQFMQIFGDINYHNDHPFIHTMYIKFLYDIASIFFKTNNNRIFFISIIQAVVNASLYSYISYLLYKKTNNILFPIITVFFYAFVFYNPVYNISISKDASFTIAANLLSISILLLMEKKDWIHIALFVICVILFCLVRKNGLYAFLYTFIIALIILIFTRRDKKIFIYLAISLLLTIFVKNTIIPIIINNMNAKEYSTSKNNDIISVSNYKFYAPTEIPMQQIASVVYHERELTQHEIELIETRCPLEIIREKYDRYIIDPIGKALIENATPKADVIPYKEYINLWLNLFAKYPQDYIESYVYLTQYYFYPNRIVDTNIYYVAPNSYNFSKEYIASESFTNTIEAIMDSQRKIPVINILYSPGTIMLIVFMFFFYSLYKKKYVISLIYSLFIGIWFTIMLVTPCADVFRYIYPVVGSIPLIIFLPFYKEEY